VTTSITDVVNRQILKWEQAAQASKRQGAEFLGSKPMISVSSAYGSRGWDIGKRAAERLGFDFYDRELVEQVASSANVRQKLVESLDERAQDWITEYISKQFEREVFTSSDFLHHLCRVLLTIAQHGRAVIMGRGSQFILKPETTLRVRTIAPLNWRIRWVADAEGVSELEARALVLRKDAERASFSLLHFNSGIAEPEHYDLLLNASSLAIEALAELVSHTFTLRFGEAGGG